MRISVIGCGYLGAVHAASMASLGHDVVGIDVNQSRVAELQAGHAPFFEPGLPELLNDALETGRLSFTTDFAAARGARVHFIAVGTPQREGADGADMRFVNAAIDALGPYLSDGDLVAGKSTVPVGTARVLAERIEPTGALLAWNPEFLREGFAVKDTLTPDRFVYGVPNGDAGDLAKVLLDEVYAAALAAGTPLIVTDYETAELVKVSANAFLATKISFINAMAELCDATGADVTQLADAIGFDTRIGRRFLNAGVGFGGGCLPKDIRAFQARAEELGAGQALEFLKNVDQINLRQRDRAAQFARDALGGSVAGRRVAILGLAFKPESDDVRDSPALTIAEALHAEGAEVRAYDPEANDTSRAKVPVLTYVDSTTEAVTGADVVLLLTEWAEFRDLDPGTVGALVNSKAIVDGRNVLDPARWRAAGFRYYGMGRP